MNIICRCSYNIDDEKTSLKGEYLFLQFRHPERFEKHYKEHPQLKDVVGKKGNVVRGSIYLGPFEIGLNVACIMPYKEEEKEMSEPRKVGNYIYPGDGTEDWFEPDTVGMVVLDPLTITRFGDTNSTPISFSLSNNSEKKVIILIAEYTVGNRKFVSNCIEMPEEEFGDQATQKIYEDKHIDQAPILIEAKKKAVENLTSKLLDAGILTGGMRFAGIGLIKIDGDNVLTAEAFDVSYTVERGVGTKSVKISQVVGQASLKNLENPEITLWTGTHKISLVRPEVKESIEAALKEYTVVVQDIIIEKCMEKPEYVVFENPNFDNEEFLENFIKTRKEMLDESINHDKCLDERFEDLFD
jgi:hypothetical protein